MSGSAEHVSVSAITGPTVVWGVRHGLSAANEAFARAAVTGVVDAGITGPDSAVELSPAGHEQAVLLGRRLGADPGQWPDVVHVSPYRRARQTADVVLAQLGPAGAQIPVVLDPRLEDLHTGVLELLTPAAIAARFPHEADERVRRGELAYRRPDGESLWDVGDRVRAFWADLQSAADGLRVLVVAHDATILMLRAVTEDLSESDILEVIAQDSVRNTAVCTWEPADGRLRMTGYNDDSHLRDDDDVLAEPGPGLALGSALAGLGVLGGG